MKLHGTNAAIVYRKDFGYRCQSRNKIITSEKDNAGFARFMYPLAEKFLTEQILFKCSAIRKHYDRGNDIVIYGE